MRARLREGRVRGPAGTDVENLAPLLSSYLDAATAAQPLPDSPALPCETLDDVRVFPDAALAVVGRSGYYGTISLSKGGACRFHDRVTLRTAYEDAGYVIGSRDRTWSSQGHGSGRGEVTVTGAAWTVRCTANFSEVRNQPLTPARFIVLRLLNLTAFRSLTVGRWIRARIIGRLITSRVASPLQLTRVIILDPDRVRFTDRIQAPAGTRIDACSLPRHFTPIHMGSAKYFDHADLEATPIVPTTEMAHILTETGAAENRFSLAFSSEPVRLSIGDTPVVPTQVREP
jgi:hypothetical protein